MQYSLLTLATVLAHTQAQYIPMPFGLAPVPFPQGSSSGSNGNGNIGGHHGVNMDYPSSMAQQMPVPTPSPASSSMHRPFHSHGVKYHYHMTPVPSSASHYINMHMSMHMSASASASMSLHVSATPSTRPSARPHFGLNHGLHAPHPHEGFSAPEGVPKAPDFTSENGASSKPGGYHGGNGNGYTQTHGQDESSDGSPPMSGSMFTPEESEQPAQESVPETPQEFNPEESLPQENTPESMPESTPQTPQEFSPEDPGVPSYHPNVPQSEHVNQNVAPFPGSAPSEQGTESIAPVDSMAPGTNVAPTQPQKSHGADIGNSFCMGDCYRSPDEAKCEKPYTSPVFQSNSGCYTCCFTSPDF